jgi:hypothetical protein
MGFFLMTTAIAVAFGAFVSWLGLRVGAMGRVALLATIIVAAIWIAGLRLIWSGWNDVDGFASCGDHCGGWHYAGGFLFWTPPIVEMALLLVLGFAAALAAWSRFNAPIGDS